MTEKACQAKGLTLEEELQSLRPNNEESTEQFFDRVQQNLREGQVRLVFFLEGSPFELRSVVDFLNRQMERSEVLLVEARQYCRDRLRIVVPTLFGYTEQARLVKKPVTITTTATLPRRKWDRESFFEEVRTKLDEAGIRSVEQLFERCISMGFQTGYGTGAISGSFSMYERTICPRSLFTVWTNVNLQMNFGWLNGTEVAERARDRFRDLLEERMGIQIQDVSKYPGYRIGQWSHKLQEFTSALNDAISDLRRNNA